MVPAMPMTSLAKKLSHWVLLLGYVLLVLTLQPLLIEHSFSAGTSHEHSDQDVCAWLDHAASAGLHSFTPLPVLVLILVATVSPPNHIFRSVTHFHASVRGPPASFL